MCKRGCLSGGHVPFLLFINDRFPRISMKQYRWLLILIHSVRIYLLLILSEKVLFAERVFFYISLYYYLSLVCYILKRSAFVFIVIIIGGGWPKRPSLYASAVGVRLVLLLCRYYWGLAVVSCDLWSSDVQWLDFLYEGLEMSMLSWGCGTWDFLYNISFGPSVSWMVVHCTYLTV